MRSSANSFWLIRHASHAGTPGILLGRNQEVGLSPRGRDEAAIMADKLIGAGIEKVVSSPTLRALETAVIVGERLNVPVAPAAELEEVDFGAWTGQSFDTLEQDPLWHAWNQARAAAQTPSGETIYHVLRRIVRLMRQLDAGFRDSSVALVTHAEPIRAVLLSCRSLSMSEWSSIDVPLASAAVVAFVNNDKAERHLVELSEAGAVRGCHGSTEV